MDFSCLGLGPPGIHLLVVGASGTLRQDVYSVGRHREAATLEGPMPKGIAFEGTCGTLSGKAEKSCCYTSLLNSSTDTRAVHCVGPGHQALP